MPQTRLLIPKLISTFAAGYSGSLLRSDAIAGLTVAIVALPLSLAIAVASGVAPERGLYAAIVGGALVSALGGSRFQIGGPAGAFIVLVAATGRELGVNGLILTVMISGVLLVLLGLLRVGSLIKHIPHAVTVGFTAGIAVTILASQLKDFTGIRLSGAEPGPIVPKLLALLEAAGTASVTTVFIGIVTATVIFTLRAWRPSWPGMLIAVALASALGAIFHLPIQTIGSAFGGLPQTIPIPGLPSFDMDLLGKAVKAAMAFAVLGGIESLLSAKVADSMTGRMHRSNMELIAQGIANLGSALFGGISVTGTIARTATNIRAGASSPVAGILHSVFLLVFILVAAPLAAYIPLAALAGVLIVVCWNMVERKEISKLSRRWQDALVLSATFLFTVGVDLITGIMAGCFVASIFWTLGSRVQGEGP